MTPANPLFRKTAIIGVGLIGGSLALSMRKRGLTGGIIGIGRTKENLEVALRRGIIDGYTTDVAEGVRGADLVVAAVPVMKITGVIREALATLEPPCVITDVGSVKAPIMGELESILPEGIDFVPAHPVAGTEESGAGAALEGLFDGKLTVITPSPRTDPASLRAVEGLWREVGSKVVRMDPLEHDRVFSLVSHLPHVIAYTLVLAVACGDGTGEGRRAIDFSAGGFRDFTRIASSSPEMWADICSMNSAFILDAIETFESQLAAIRELIETSGMEALKERFEKAKGIRDSLG